MRRILLTGLLVTTFACGGDDGPQDTVDASNPGGPDAAGPGEPDAAPPPPGSFSLQFGPLAGVAPGYENTQCVQLRLGNTEPLRVNQIHNVLGRTSHHMIVYRLTDGDELPEPYDCTPFVDTINPDNGQPLVVTQKFDETIQLPEGVAFTLEPNQLVRIEMHYINTSDEPRDVEGTVTFIPIAEAAFQYEASFLFIGNPDIDIPPMSQLTLGPTFFPVPAELADLSFFGITGHEHQFGTDVTIEVVASADGPGTMVYDPEPFLWDEPETVYHDPPFTVPQGGGFRFSCSWNNTSRDNVGFGESANDEMCFFWAYYYPSVGARTCVHTDQLGGWDVCCPGHFICSQIDDAF